MFENIEELIIAWAPAIGAMGTIILTVVKLMKTNNKEFNSLTEIVKNDKVDNDKTLNELKGIIIDEIANNKELRKQNEELQRQLSEVIAMKEDIKALETKCDQLGVGVENATKEAKRTASNIANTAVRNMAKREGR